MENYSELLQYVAFLRGINVGGHHKVPMEQLKELFVKLGYNDIRTLLNSGNVIFSSRETDIRALEITLNQKLTEAFGFPIPVLIRKSQDIQNYISAYPFSGVVINRDIRLYVTFLGEQPSKIPKLPWTSPDTAFRISKIIDSAVFSVLDLAKSQTTDAMSILEKFFGKEITTRNWNTIEKIGKLM